MSRPKPLPIASAQNPKYKLWESLLGSRGIRKSGLFLLSGRKLVPEALRRWPGRFQAVLRGDAEDTGGLEVPAAIDEYVLDRPLFAQLDTFGTGTPLAVGSLPPLPPADLQAPPAGLELVCALSDPSNLGAVLRSAAAFGVSRVFLLEEAAHPFHPRALRAGANAAFELELMRAGQWSALAAMRGPAVALDAAGDSLSGFRWPRDLRLVLGEEGLGLPASLPLQRLAVPSLPRVESLNATVAASIAMYAHYTANAGRD